MKCEINVIFDFDGTIADSFLPAMQKFNLLADEFGFRHVNDNEVEGARNLSSHELIKYFHIPFYKLPKILTRAREMMRDEMQTISPVPRMNSFLLFMKKRVFLANPIH